MPGFDRARGFPGPSDDLPRLPVATWGPLVFASLGGAAPFADWTAGLERRMAWFPKGELRFDPARSREYDVAANWALYCDNYLEGFHLPYVHTRLAAAIDYSQYTTELHRWSSLQLGVAAGSEEVFDLPPGHRDFGRRVAVYWFWLFPNLMLNIYPWGVSVNVIKPLAVDRTKVSFLNYPWDPAQVATSAGNSIDRVEREDEAVVEAVQRGVRSRIYRRGRYSPRRETGVHHFHRLMAEALA